MLFSHLLLRLALCLCVLSVLLAPLSAQETSTKDTVFPIAAGAAPQRSRLEGTIESTVNGVTARANIKVQGPGQMLLEIQENAAAQIEPQAIVVANGETRIFDPATRRIQRLPYSVLGLRGWNLQSGGPANFALANHADGLRLPAGGKIERAGFEQAYVSDYVRFGGSGDRIFYAPFKRTQWDGAAKVLLEWKGTGPVQMRTELDESGRVLSRATLTYDAKGIPVGAVVTDANSRVLAEFKYSLKEVTEPFPAQTFDFDFAPGQIVEDAQTEAISEYSGRDASSLFNRGVALMRQAEEIPAAFAAWEEAAKLSPQATAPHFATYEAALASRDLGRAEVALTNLMALLGTDSFPVAWRTAGILLARRDWAGAQAALTAATKIEPQNLQAKLSLADVLRSRGDFEGAQQQLLAVLAAASQQSRVQAEAVQMLAGIATAGHADKVLEALPDSTPWQNLARAVIRLRSAQDYGAPATTDVAALSVWAQELERAGHDQDALAAWQKIIETAPSPMNQPARAHLMALFARRGDVSASLAQYRELIATAPDLKSRRSVQEQFISSWRKAFRQEELRKVLEQRMLSTSATPDDARLWLTYQEGFGTAEEIAAAIKGGMARFTRDAWWRARQSELIMAQAAQTLATVDLERLQREALKVAEDAVTLDPDQPYYAIQRALILTQRATPITAVHEAGKYDGAKRVANEALDELLKKWPDDPDVQIAAAAQRLALEDDTAHAGSIALLQTALRGGVPGPGEDRHFISFSSRQMLISALRRSKQWDALTPQYEILFRASRTGEEQLGVALNYARLLMNRDDPAKLANLLLYFARESWPFEESQQALLPLLNVVAVRDQTLAPVLAALKNSPDPYARYLLARLYSLQTRTARRVLAEPNAPDRAERDLIAAATNLAAALKELEPLVDAGDKILASRAAAALGEEAMNRSAPQEAERWLARAIELEPRDINLRVALATALMAQDKNKQALAVRDEMLRVLQHSFDTVHRAAKLSSRIGETADREFTAQLAAQAANMGAASPLVSAGSWQLAAYTAARASFDAGKVSAGTPLYEGLANSQWSPLERAVALIDFEESLKLVGRNDQAAKAAKQLEELNLTPQQRQRAEEIWSRLGD